MDSLGQLKISIQQKLAGGSKQFAVFDFDNTCIKGDIGESTLKYLSDAGRIAKDSFERYTEFLKRGDISGAYAFNARMFTGMREVEAAAGIEAAIVAGSLSINESVKALMDFLKDQGVAVWIMSASSEAAVQVAMRHFGIEANLIGVRSVLKEGRYTDELIKPLPILEGKVACMKKYIDQEQSPLLVVDDSPTGLPILEIAEIKVVLNYNKIFVAEAKQRGWFII